MGGSQTLAVSIARGDGLVARFGDVVMYIADATGSADRLLAAVESVADTQHHPGAAIAQRLAAFAFGPEAAKTAPFGVVAPTADGLLVLLRGKVTATIDTAEGAHELSGERAFTWVDEIVPASVRHVAITSGGSRASGCPNTDLRAGVVPGGGFVLHRASAKADWPSRPESVAPEPVPIAAIDEPTQRSSSPADTAPAMKAAPSPAHTAPLLRAPAETATVASVGGVLASEEGAVYPLDRPYVIGRDPLGDEAVRNQLASPIVVHNDPHISRVHAHISIDGGTVSVRDASTPGGTFIAAPGAEDWTQIGTTPTELGPGWSLRIGELILTYRTGT